MKKNINTFKSSDGNTDISVINWIPDGEIIAILQICHGMMEYIDRYDEFATFLAHHGFLVVGHDHLGHGDSINTKEDWGFFHDEHGNKILLDDINILMKNVREKWPDKDYYLMGHSMGSFLVRQFMFTYSIHNISGCIIMGTGQKSKMLISLGKYLAEKEGKKNGWKKPNKKVKRIFVKENIKHFKNPRTLSDWLTKDETVIDRYNKDPKCTFDFSNRAYYDMFKGILTLNNNSNLKRLDKKIPYLLISGEDDPIGDFGKGVKKLYGQYKNIGIKDVILKLFRNDRHEILNETDKNQVFEIIYNWMISKKVK